MHIKLFCVQSVTSCFLLIFILVGAGCKKVSVQPDRSVDIYDKEKVVNICDWYGMLSPELLKAFEKQTGIKVRYDVFDSNDVLEAKLLATKPGYDVVFPTATPYALRQIKMKLYQKLNKQLLPDLKNLDGNILNKMDKVDPQMDYVIPYYWGTLGIAYNKKKLEEIFPGEKIDSYAFLFDSNKLKKLQKCGVGLLIEAIDVFPHMQLYLNKNPNEESDRMFKETFEALVKIRPYFRRFTSGRFMNDLIMEDLCVSQAWSGEVHAHRKELKEMDTDIRYIIPKEGTALWIDCIAIPQYAPHIKNAHAFINFLLQPQIAAQITNTTGIPTIVRDASKYLEADILNDPAIYPSEEMMKKNFIIYSENSDINSYFEKLRNKYWIDFRLNKRKLEK